MPPSKSTAPKPQTNGVAAPLPDIASTGGPPVNRKKQKKRAKAAARLAAEQSASQSGSEAKAQAHSQNSEPAYASAARQPNGSIPDPVSTSSYHTAASHDNYGSHPGEDIFYSEEDAQESVYITQKHARGADLNRNDALSPPTKSKKKNKNKALASTQEGHSAAYASSSAMGRFRPPSPPPPLLDDPLPHVPHALSNDRIWNTSTAEERERIRDFWLSLEETDRRSLVKVEKEAVLRKMKEQQKHSCSCSVCGRKRTAIEEELEALYDAYYEELERYANHQQISLIEGAVMPPTSMSSLRRMAQGTSSRASNLQPPPPASRRIAGEFIEEEDEEAYSDEAEASEDDYYPGVPGGPASDFFQFGNSLTVDSGILTVADDLLKNDGKKFIEMMEQLAERRMQRETEAAYPATDYRHPNAPLDSHGEPLDEEAYDDEVEDDYGSEEDEEDDGRYQEEEDMVNLTDEQRMEEGRRMFQIFAARMFEQRVLTAYREKVARERQERLLEELANEDLLGAQREAKKAKEAAKKKEKKKQQKAAKEEERQKKEAEKAAEENAVREAEEQRLEEQRQKKEEQRKKKEAERKALEEEKARKESERQRKLQEAREQQAEVERKQREAKEKERKRKDDARKKEREQREAKEREKKERELAEKREKEAKEKAEREARQNARKEELSRREEQAKHSLQEAPMLQPAPPRKGATPAVPAPPGLGGPYANHASPHPQVATPIVPKAPTPMRTRQTSNQGSHQSSPKSAHLPTVSTAGSPSTAYPAQVATVHLPGHPRGLQQTPLSQAQPAPLMSPTVPPGIFPDASAAMTSPSDISTPGYPPYHRPMMPETVPRGPSAHDLTYSQQPFSAPPHRAFHNLGQSAFPPEISSMRAGHHGRGSPVNGPAAQAPIGSGVGASGLVSSASHSRQTSMEQPISRPNPIQRPSSSPQKDDRSGDDELKAHLGSSALLDDADETLGVKTNDPRGPIGPVGQRPTRLGFGASPVFSDALGSAKSENFRGWGAPQIPFGPTPMSHPPTWPHAAGAPNPLAHHRVGTDMTPGLARPKLAMGPAGANRTLPLPVQLRLQVCEACRRLDSTGADKPGMGPGFHSLDALLHVMEQMRGGGALDAATVQVRDLLDICETEGNAQNGGGTFQTKSDRGVTFVQHQPDGNSAGPMAGHGAGGGHGDIGSPVTGSAIPFRTFGRGGISAPGF